MVHGLLGLHFLAFWPRGPSFPFILAFSGSASGVLPTSCQKWPVCPTSLQWIYQRRDRLHFAVFSLLGLHFLAFWPCGLSFPCILASWAFISWHFCLFGASGVPPPHKLPKMARLPNVLTMDLSAPGPAPFCSFLPSGPLFPCILALWAFISLHFGFVGLHFLAFWPCGPSFPCILALWAFISFYFGILGLHFLLFWPCGPSFPCILALWAFISLHFGLVGFISFHFGLFGVSFWGPPHKLPKMARLPNVLTMDVSAP